MYSGRVQVGQVGVFYFSLSSFQYVGYKFTISVTVFFKVMNHRRTVVINEVTFQKPHSCWITSVLG